MKETTERNMGRGTEQDTEEGRGKPKRRQIWGMKGSYTVEAAAVVSMTVLVLASFAILSFYVHDAAVLQGYVCYAAAGMQFAPAGGQ